MKAVQSRIRRGTLKARKNRSGKNEVSESELSRLLDSLGLEKDDEGLDTGTFTTDDYTDLSDPDSLLKERGLEPDEWDVTHMKVNEWDGPFGNPLKQLTVNVRRKLSKTFPQPAFTPDDYVAPPKKEPTSDSQRLVVFVGDQQAPHHDVHLHETFCNWLRKNKPQEGVLIGDTVDFGDISRHARNPEWDSSVQACINAGYSILKDYVKASPNTKWVKLMGNHDERIRNKLLQQVASLYDVRQADDGNEAAAPVWCVSHLLRLKALGIDFIAPNGGYKHAQAIISNKLAARHGWVAKKGSGASALATLEALGYSIVVGHTHRQGIVHKTKHDIDGSIQTLAAVETGCMCKIKEGLGYAVAPDWQNGFATASVWKDGTFKLDLATYANSTLYWRDSKYE